MNELFHSPLIAVGALVVNFVWSSLNLRLLRSMEKRFVTKEQFHSERRIRDLMHEELIGRLNRAGA